MGFNSAFKGLMLTILLVYNYNSFLLSFNFVFINKLSLKYRYVKVRHKLTLAHCHQVCD